MAYTGLPVGLRMRVYARDQHRCRWCGRTNVGCDIHHVRYRRGVADDVIENLILLCRQHHEFIHGQEIITATGRVSISKNEAQEILGELVDMPGVTGLALRRQRRAAEQQTA